MAKIKVHSRLQLPFFIGLSGFYIILKYTLTPLIYLLRKMGLNPGIPSKVDSTINQLVLPLTETPDSTSRMDMKPALKKGDVMPGTEMRYPDGSIGALDKYTNAPLLLIFVRGSWCSYSRLRLSDVMFSKEAFDNAGVQLLVITSYGDQEWWRSHGVDLPMCIDSKGDIFNDFGVRIRSWTEFAWGRILPHESAFLFDQNKRLVESDVRKISSIQPGQHFLGSKKWLELIRTKI